MDSRGTYISHDILHSARRKRSIPSSESSLHYKFSAFGQELHLELKPSVLFSHSFSVQVLGKDGLAASQEHHVDQCFYQGFIRNYSLSSVAISTCLGLVSVSFKKNIGCSHVSAAVFCAQNELTVHYPFKCSPVLCSSVLFSPWP